MEECPMSEPKKPSMEKVALIVQRTVARNEQNFQEWMNDNGYGENGTPDTTDENRWVETPDDPERTAGIEVVGGFGAMS
jgi:hypothetical protein